MQLPPAPREGSARAWVFALMPDGMLVLGRADGPFGATPMMAASRSSSRPPEDGGGSESLTVAPAARPDASQPVAFGGEVSPGSLQQDAHVLGDKMLMGGREGNA